MGTAQCKDIQLLASAQISLYDVALHRVLALYSCCTSLVSLCILLSLQSHPSCHFIQMPLGGLIHLAVYQASAYPPAGIDCKSPFPLNSLAYLDIAQDFSPTEVPVSPRASCCVCQALHHTKRSGHAQCGIPWCCELWCQTCLSDKGWLVL